MQLYTGFYKATTRNGR